MFNLENIINAVIAAGRVKRSASFDQDVELMCWKLGKLEVSLVDNKYQLWHKGAGKAILLGILAS